MNFKKILFLTAIFFVSFKLIKLKIYDYDNPILNYDEQISITCNKLNSVYNTSNLKLDKEITKKTFAPNLNKGKRVLLIMTHGLVLNDKSFSIGEFKNIEKALSKKYPKSKIDFIYINLDKSVTLSLTKQSDLIECQLSNYIKKHKINPNTNILIIGHCTGALAGYNFYTKYKNKYNIRGIVSSNTPWHGVNVLKNRNNHFSYMFKNVIGKRFFCIYSDERDTIKQIRPESEFLQNQKKNLKDSELPIWAIGSVSNFYKKLSVPSVAKLIINKNKTEKCLYGSLYNDGLVSLESQIGIFHKNIKSIILNENAIHSAGLKYDLADSAQNMSKIAKFFISKNDFKILLAIQNEPSITQTNHYLGLIFNFVEKYGIYSNLKYEDDDVLINKIKCISPEKADENKIVLQNT